MKTPTDDLEADARPPTSKTTTANTHLASEGERRLVKALLLRIANVRVDDSLEGQLVPSLELVAEVFSLDGEFATDSILDIEYSRVEVGDGELVHIS